MMLRGSLLALVLVLAVGSSYAGPRRVACRAAGRSCLQAANTAFATARSACVAFPVGPERRGCVKAARAVRATARQACRAALRRCVGAGGGGGGGGSGSCNASHAADWLATVNLYRGLANLPAVTERTDLSAADAQHAQYMVANDEIGHSEDPAKSGYTDAGNAAAQHSNVAGTSDASAGFG
jgi:uncharacterized protein YkwD